MKRLQEEDRRQNARIDGLEKTVEEINKLTVSVEKLAITMEHMLSEQKIQGERLERLEAAPAESYFLNRRAFINAVIGAIGDRKSVV